MHKGTTFVETLFFMVISLIVLGAIASILVSGFHQLRQERFHFQLFQKIDHCQNYLLSLPFDSQVLSVGLHAPAPDFSSLQWTVEENTADLKRITLQYKLNNHPRRWVFFKSRSIKEVKQNEGNIPD